ncbi:sugar ABC transporter ATP-binding protein [Lichenicoccus sp.]|uniref:sugar ABC transporter ATP-binding protein n=1 Tax=Lichenicoccus sp. TaxID=2781899 RepID=UPI003D0AA801
MPSATDHTPAVLVRFIDIARSFGPVRALDGVDLAIEAGECLGLVGHNGAGKSTLINLLTGALTPSSGTMQVFGATSAVHDPRAARALGIRCVFQELSLCPNLTVAENTRLVHPGLRGRAWSRRAAALIKAALDAVFPGHRIRVGAPVASLSLTERQMVEIARAFTTTDVAPRLVILDEPTSSLDASTAAQLLAHIRRMTQQGCSVLLVTHMLHEVLQSADRIAVMRDGRVVGCDPATRHDRDSLVALMSGGTHRAAVARTARDRRTGSSPVLQVRAKAGPKGGENLVANAGEVIGLGGLAGHGQTEFLVDLFSARTMAMVAGDRKRDGVFPLWSIGENISVGAYRKHLRHGLLDPARERASAEDWRGRMKIRAPDMDSPILSLSGGNQQKALFARALDSEARIILMDDPMRGVDVQTKQDVYAMIRAQAASGRTFLWYTTEMDELYECDRVYVFREGRIMAVLGPEEITEARVLQASF